MHTSSTIVHPLLYCSHVQKYFGTRTNITKALNGISFGVEKGEFVGIMGPSGSGKTTLLNCISTIDTPTTGSIYIDGHDLGALKGSELAKFRRETLGFVFQDGNLLDTLTGRENIALALTIQKVPAKEINGRVDAIAQKLGITNVLNSYPHQMSGGQRQRVAAARAVVGEPELVLADEPTGSLDSKSSRELLGCFEKLHQEGTTILMVTHDSFAASYADRIIVIKDGVIFNELTRGAKDKRSFFNEIMDVVSYLGGEDVDES